MGKGARGRGRRVRQVEPLHLALAVGEWQCRGAATSSHVCGEGEGVTRRHVKAVEPSASHVWGEGGCCYEEGCERREKKITITYLPSHIWEGGALHSPAFEVKVAVGGEKVIPLIMVPPIVVLSRGGVGMKRKGEAARTTGGRW
jgi:hypothetical protein